MCDFLILTIRICVRPGFYMPTTPSPQKKLVLVLFDIGSVSHECPWFFTSHGDMECLSRENREMGCYLAGLYGAVPEGEGVSLPAPSLFRPSPLPREVRPHPRGGHESATVHRPSITVYYAVLAPSVSPALPHRKIPQYPLIMARKTT